MSDHPERFPRRDFLIAVVGFASLGALGGTILSGARTLAQDAATQLPAWAAAPPRTARAYRVALNRTDLLAQLPCYCGCMTSATTNHANLRDCFVHSDGTLEAHAVGCGVCIDQALDADDWAAASLSLAQIRQRTDEKYDQFGCTTQRCVE
jgi:hypothetical protein